MFTKKITYEITYFKNFRISKQNLERTFFFRKNVYFS